jgi:hypothetical protein
LRPSAEKIGGFTAVLLYAHKRSVTSTIAKEKSKATTKRACGNTVVRPFFILNRCESWRLVTVMWNVETMSRAMTSTSVFPTSKVTADTPQTEHQPESTDTPGVPGPHTHCMPIVPSSFVLFALIVSGRRAMYKKTSFHVEGQSPSNKSVLEPTTSLVGPARCLSYSTRFQWRPNESGTVLLHDSLCLWVGREAVHADGIYQICLKARAQPNLV